MVLTRLSMAGLALLAMTASLVAGQQPARQPVDQPPSAQKTPPRDTAARGDEAKGTAILRGTVTVGKAGTPVRRAVVWARSLTGGATAVASTDDRGRFEIRDLRAGRYNVTAMKSGLLTGAPRTDGDSPRQQLVDVVDGQVIDKLAIVMSRGGVISGRVVDEFGDPMVGARVAPMLVVSTSAGRSTLPGATFLTDDHGVFRAHTLAPGEYLVSVMAPYAPRGVEVTGSVDAGYVTTYYPGVDAAGDARAVIVAADSETAGVNFAMAASRLARVSGRVVLSTGEAATIGTVRLLPADAALARVSAVDARMATVADGHFTIQAVPPGVYQVLARFGEEFGLAPLTVTGTDIDGVDVSTSRGATVRGTIRLLEDGGPQPLPNEIRIDLQPVNLNDGFPRAIAEPVRPDGRFEMRDVFGAQYFRMSTTGGRFFLDSILHRGVEVTDSAIDTARGTVLDGFEVVLTTRHTVLSGTVAGSTADVSAGAPVLVFDQDSRRWRTGSRFVRMIAATREGAFEFIGLPPSDYFVIALSSMQPGHMQDATFLESVSRDAQRVTLRLGEPATQSLQVVRRP